MAEQRGMVLRLPPVQPRSRKAFEASEFARLQGRFDPMHRALFRAFFEEGRDLAELDALVEIGRSVGLDGEELRNALQSGRHTQKVQADQQMAAEIGISGVPALVISAGEKGYLVSGAQPYEALHGVLDRVVRAEALAS
jgi:predicted DsbA family dithiol-disulfide isomerase